MNEIQNEQVSGSKNEQSLGVLASNIINSDLKEDGHRACNMSELGNPAKPFHQNELDIDETMRILKRRIITW